jgi:hypothetical protein
MHGKAALQVNIHGKNTIDRADFQEWRIKFSITRLLQESATYKIRCRFSIASTAPLETLHRFFIFGITVFFIYRRSMQKHKRSGFSAITGSLRSSGQLPSST